MDDFTDIKFSLKLYLNLLVYHRNIFGSSWKVFGNLRKFSEILGKCSGTFVWPSEQFWKIFGNLRKVVGNLLYFILLCFLYEYFIRVNGELSALLSFQGELKAKIINFVKILFGKPNISKVKFVELFFPFSCYLRENYA